MITDTGSVSAAMEDVMILPGGIDSFTTYTAKLVSTRISSEHVEIANHLVTPKYLNLEMIPDGWGTLTIRGRMDHTHNDPQPWVETRIKDPFGYDLLLASTDTADSVVNPFYVGSTDSDSSQMASDFERASVHVDLDVGHGRFFEFELEISDGSDFTITGLEIGLDVGESVQSDYVNKSRVLG